jgi:hypothetical protein
VTAAPQPSEAGRGRVGINGAASGSDKFGGAADDARARDFCRVGDNADASDVCTQALHFVMAALVPALDCGLMNGMILAEGGENAMTEEW